MGLALGGVSMPGDFARFSNLFGAEVSRLRPISIVVSEPSNRLTRTGVVRVSALTRDARTQGGSNSTAIWSTEDIAARSRGGIRAMNGCRKVVAPERGMKGTLR